MSVIATKNSLTLQEYHLDMSSTFFALISSHSLSVEYIALLSKLTSWKYLQYLFQASLRSNSLYFLGLRAKTQNVADNQRKATPANANQWSRLFHAFATKPSRTPFDASKIPALDSNSLLSCQISENLLQAKSSITSSIVSIFSA